MKRRFCSGLILLFFRAAFSLAAQDFGFGFDDEAGTEGGGIVPAVSISGEAAATLLGYGSDFYDGADSIRFGNIFSGKLNFTATNSFAKGIVNFKINPDLIVDHASFMLTDVLDEAYIDLFFGDFEIAGGLRKLTWGKADSMGPLDVLNPLDYSELTDMRDMLNRKIARPLIHASYRLGSFTKLEGVFVPWFEPHRLSSSGRWMFSQMKLLAALPSAPSTPDTSTVAYAQAGLRFTTTIGSSDIGAQYYYGRLPTPAFKAQMILPPLVPVPIATISEIAYNSYHQTGVDWASVIAGFNLRAECAANITGDLSGDDGAVYNPYLAWSLGFDRDTVWGINLNLQCNETIRLLDNKIESPLDMEADRDITATRITAIVSKKMFRDELELRAAVLWNIEDRDFLITPSLVWTLDAVSVELSGGIFGGDEDGQFGQFRDNNFVKAVLKYAF
ncbi:MAG: hypothetical protein Pg6A_12750 [Termitinemataceae bacterium]|nr:MAG: hypothetical protein Pg6A_12750 [Termitinemataceae bacterium]